MMVLHSGFFFFCALFIVFLSVYDMVLITRIISAHGFVISVQVPLTA